MNRELNLTVDFYQVASRLNFTDDFCVTKIKKYIFLHRNKFSGGLTFSLFVNSDVPVSFG